jgi:dephospho-CoA kinase
MVFRPDPPLVIGLLGGVAAGKSTIAAALAARGLQHVDADRLAREVAAEGPVLREIAAAFGAGVLDAAGRLDRAALAAIAFRDAAARQRLEALVHPRVRAAIVAATAAARAAGVSVVLDVPLLLERGLIEACDVVVFVQSSEAARRARAAARGWPPGEFERREAAQAPLADKRARAEFVLDNDGPLDAVGRRVDDLLRALPAGRPRAGGGPPGPS